MTDAPTSTAPSPSVLAALQPATYSVADLARLTQSSERHIHRLNDLGKVPGRIKGLGRLVRFSKTAVDEWLGNK
jgi:excisionase family DNA binding protein